MNSTSSSLQAVARFGVVVLDCPDARALASFYSAVLGWEVVDEDDDWVTLHDPQSTGTTKVDLAFQRADEFTAPTWPKNDVPQQSHLDLYVADLDVGEAAVLALGARLTGMPEGDHDFRVYLDPVGHPFCLCKEG